MQKNERGEPLRHGWGGDLDRWDQVLANRAADALELQDHPFADGKFGEGDDYVLTPDDLNLLEAMQQRSK